MKQSQRRAYLIRALLDEKQNERNVGIPISEEDQKRLLRSLMNVRAAAPIAQSVLTVQDEYLQEEIRRAGITDVASLQPICDQIYLWKGDITTLRCGAIVNAANSGLTGCYQPCHACIDNCIHSFAGMQLRLNCAQIMEKQGYAEPTGTAKITPAYNLPCDYVLHTVGPIIGNEVRKEDERLLACCYLSCMELAQQHGIDSIAFCCISTGAFRFPKVRAAEIAVETVRSYLQEKCGGLKVIFNVFGDVDYEIYRRLLAEN